MTPEEIQAEKDHVAEQLRKLREREQGQGR